MKGKPTVFAARALLMTASNLAPFLAQDHSLDLLPIFKPLKAADKFDKAKFQGALDEALKGKLAHDVQTNHIAELVNNLHLAADGKDESASEEQKKAMEASAKDKAKDEFPKNAMDRKGYDWLKANDRKAFDAMAKACDMDFEDAEDEESEEDNEEQRSAANRAPGDKKGGKDKKGKDKMPGKDEKEDDMGKDGAISKVAFDAAMKTQAEQLEKSITDRVNKQNRDKAAAVALGEKKLGRFDHAAFDSAAQVKHAVLEGLGNKQHKDITEEIALDAMISLYPDVGTMRPAERNKLPGGRAMAMDSAAKTELDAILGEDSGFKQIRVGV